MKKHITITRQDVEQKPISVVIGEAVIGSALIANCKDERISRKHGLITVSKEGEVLLTSIESMFYIPAGQVKRQILLSGSTLVLNNGDRFSFLPQRFCFQIKIADVLESNVRKRKGMDVSEGVVAGQRDQEDISPEELKRIKLQTVTEPQPSTSRDADNDHNDQLEQKGSEHKECIEDTLPETPEKSLLKELPGAREEKSAEEKPSQTEDTKDGDANQEHIGNDEEEAGTVYAETEGPSDRQETTTSEENEDKDHQKEAHEPMSLSQFVCDPSSSNLLPLQEFWSRGILPTPTSTGESKVDKPAYPEENPFKEDDFRPLCPHGKTCFNLTPKHRRDFSHDVPEPQTKSSTSSSDSSEP